MSARDTILARLGPASLASDALDAQAAALLADPERPAVIGDPEAIFAERLALPSVAATYAVIDDMADLPAAAAAYLSEHALPRAICAPDPALAALDWHGITLHADPAPDEPVALAIADCGVAETGSLVFGTGPDSPMLPNFLALHHIVVVPRLVRHLEDTIRPGPQPRGWYWVTGVSGTTDIEGTYVRGAHGPRYLHVIRMKIRT